MLYTFTPGTGSCLITSDEGYYKDIQTGNVDIDQLSDAEILITKPGFSLQVNIDEIDDIDGSGPAGTIAGIVAQFRAVFPDAGGTGGSPTLTATQIAFGSVGNAISSSNKLAWVSDVLTITGGLKLVTGAQGNGKVWTSDANGLGSWVTPTVYAGLVSPVFTTPRLASTSTIGHVWTATDGSGNGSFQAPAAGGSTAPTRDVVYINKDFTGLSALPGDMAAVGSPGYSVGSNKLSFTGAGGASYSNGYTKYIKSTLGVLMDTYTLSADITLDAAPSSALYGAAIGMQSYSSVSGGIYANQCIRAGLVTKSDDVNYGKPFIQSGYTPSIYYGATANTNLNSGDVINVSLIRKGWDWIVVVVNTTQSWTVRMTYNHIEYGAQIAHNSSNPSIYHLGGSVSVDNFKYTINCPAQLDMIVVGNSLTYGQAATTSHSRFTQLLGNSKNILVSGGGADIVKSIEDRILELTTLAPKRVWLHDPAGNDILFGVSSGTWQAGLVTIRTALVAAGIEVIWSDGSPRTATDTTAQKTYIDATFKQDLIIPAWAALLGTGYALAPKNDWGDGTHYSDRGENALANAANQKLSLSGPRNNMFDDIDVNGMAFGYGTARIIYNTVAGVLAGNAYTTGNFNTAIGWWNQKVCTTGSNNTGTGAACLTALTTGSSNGGFGVQCLRFLTTGNFNNAFGYSAGYNITTGSYNTVMGNNALLTVTTASFNSAFGADALNANTSGAYNFAGGYQAGKLNTSGDQNTFCGGLAGSWTTTGRNNTFIGCAAGHTISTGSGNVVIGADIPSVGNVTDNIILGAGAAVKLRYNGVWAFTGTIKPQAGTATASTAPLLFTAGTLLTTPELGAVEFTDDGTTGKMYVTVHIAGVVTRKEIAFV